MAIERTEEQEHARQQLIDAVRDWRAAICPYAQPPGIDGELCVGDNHLIDCPVERGRQDILSAHDKVERLRAG